MLSRDSNILLNLVNKIVCIIYICMKLYRNLAVTYERNLPKIHTRADPCPLGGDLLLSPELTRHMKNQDGASDDRDSNEHTNKRWKF